jgi:hypothetical protein
LPVQERKSLDWQFFILNSIWRFYQVFGSKKYIGNILLMIIMLGLSPAVISCGSSGGGGSD